MILVVTGCSGFIVANFSKYWIDNYTDDEVIGVDCLTYAANIPALEALKKRENFQFYKVNICDKETIEQIFGDERPDVVINFAAESHVDRSIEDSRVFVETNVLGTQTLLDACLNYGIKRFHQVSTDEVYGDLPIENDEKFTEDSSLKPSSPYSASKAAADLLVLSYFRTHGLQVTISRSSNNYGKYQHPEKLIPKIIQYAMNGEPFPIYGDGLNVRDWIYVDDHCRAIDLIVRNGVPGNVYNVGGGVLLSNIVLIKKVLRQLNKPEDFVRFTSDRKGHDRKYALDCQKIERELDWKAQVSFEIGLKETIEHYLSNVKKS